MFADYEDQFIPGRPTFFTPYTVNGQPTPADDLHICPECGDYIEDGSVFDMGKPVQYARHEMGGQLSKPTHAMCAASWLLSQMACDNTFYAQDESRETIDAIVRGAK